LPPFPQQPLLAAPFRRFLRNRQPRRLLRLFRLPVLRLPVLRLCRGHVLPRPRLRAVRVDPQRVAQRSAGGGRGSRLRRSRSSGAGAIAAAAGGASVWADRGGSSGRQPRRVKNLPCGSEPPPLQRTEVVIVRRGERNRAAAEYGTVPALVASPKYGTAPPPSPRGTVGGPPTGAQGGIFRSASCDGNNHSCNDHATTAAANSSCASTSSAGATDCGSLKPLPGWPPVASPCAAGRLGAAAGGEDVPRRAHSAAALSSRQGGKPASFPRSRSSNSLYGVAAKQRAAAAAAVAVASAAGALGPRASIISGRGSRALLASSGPGPFSGRGKAPQAADGRAGGERQFSDEFPIRSVPEHAALQQKQQQQTQTQQTQQQQTQQQQTHQPIKQQQHVSPSRKAMLRGEGAVHRSSTGRVKSEAEQQQQEQQLQQQQQQLQEKKMTEAPPMPPSVQQQQRMQAMGQTQRRRRNMSNDELQAQVESLEAQLKQLQTEHLLQQEQAKQQEQMPQDAQQRRLSQQRQPEHKEEGGGNGKENGTCMHT
ncbi:hypothetical protein CLOP_g16746, partial [Closterium sp. NIES-67]